MVIRMNRTEIAQLLGVCSAAFPHVAVTKQTAQVYGEMLADLEFAGAVQAVRGLLATSEYFPSIALIRRAYAKQNGQLAPDIAQAWAEVLKQASEVGHGALPNWSHETIRSTVQTLGWRNICMSDNVVALRAHFWKTFGEYKATFEHTAIVGASLRAIEP